MRIASRSRTSGFTLMELLVVISIIVILAGLTLGGMSYVGTKQAREQAKIQINLLQMALEDYKADNGEYPSGGRRGQEPISAVFDALFPTEREVSNEGARIYLTELDPDNDKQGWLLGQAAASNGGLIIYDPWGEPYQYRTGSQAVNPDFDLWSKGPDGETFAPNGNYDPKNSRNLDDIRGW